MEHMAWKGRIKPGCKAEYQRRHAEIWPDRWNEYMKDILELEMDPVTGAQPKLEQVFRLD